MKRRTLSAMFAGNALSRHLYFGSLVIALSAVLPIMSVGVEAQTLTQKQIPGLRKSQSLSKKAIIYNRSRFNQILRNYSPSVRPVMSRGRSRYNTPLGVPDVPLRPVKHGYLLGSRIGQKVSLEAPPYIPYGPYGY